MGAILSQNLSRVMKHDDEPRSITEIELPSNEYFNDSRTLRPWGSRLYLR